MIYQNAQTENTQNQFSNAIRELQLGKLLCKANITKNCGVPAYEVFQFLLLLVFQGKNLFRFLNSKHKAQAVSKNTYYRFLNETSYNWNRFLLLLAARVITVFDKLTRKERVKVLLLDDSVIKRNRSKKVELLARIYEMEAYTLEIDDNYDHNGIEAGIDHHNVVITAKEYGGTSLFLRGKIGDEFCGETEIGIQVTDGYTNLLPYSVENVLLGEMLDLSSIPWSIMRYHEMAAPNGEDISELLENGNGRLRTEYDENAWEPTTDPGDWLLALQRKGGWGTNVTVIAEVKQLDEEGNPICEENGDCIWEEIARRDLWFDGLDYRIDFAQSYGDTGDRFFVDAPLILTLKTSEDSPYELPEGFTVEWAVKQYQEDGTEIRPDFITLAPGDNGKTATLTFQLEGGTEHIGEWFDICASVFYDNEEITSYQKGFEIRESIYDYELPLSGPGNSEMLFGGELFIDTSMGCWAENASHPYGIYSQQNITKVEISRYYAWDDTQEDWRETNTQIVRLEGNNKDGWTLCGEDYGMAKIKITYELAEGDVNPPEREIEVYVSRDIYRLYWNYPEGREGQMLPDTEMTLTDFSMIHEYISKDNDEYRSEEVTNFSLSVTNDEGTPTYNTELFEVAADGKELTIKSTGQTGSDNIYLRGMQGRDELCGAEIWMEVMEDYYQIFCNDIIAAPGETFSIQALNPSVRHFTADCPDGTEVNASFVFEPSSNDRMIITEDSVSIQKDFVPKEQPQEERIDIFVAVEGTDIGLGGSVRVYICKHNWQTGEITQNPSCESNGEQSYECRYCQTIKTETIAAIGHSWNAGVVTRKPSCTVAGEKTFTCGRCSQTRTETIAATGHSWSAGVVTRKPSCTAAGEKTFTCGRCGQTRTETIAATGHNWGTWATKEAATALKKAKQTRTCSICQATESREYGKPLKATVRLAASSLKMKTRQKVTISLVSGLAKGDSVRSIKSNNTKLLKVSGVKSSGSCKLSAQKKTGAAKLTIKLASGLTKTIKVTVQKKTVKTTKISGLPKKLTMKKGTSYKLVAVLTPLTSQQKVTYNTSDKKVISVNGKGQLKVKKVGKAKITVKSGSKKVTINVTVKKK